MNLYAYLDDDLVSMHLSERLLSFESEVADMSVKVNKHSKWDLVGYSGGLPGMENAEKRWRRPIGPICFSVYFDASP